MVRSILAAALLAALLTLNPGCKPIAPATTARTLANHACMDLPATSTAAPAPGPTVINDAQIMFNLQRRATALAAHDHVNLATLVAQLTRTSCHLTLPPPALEPLPPGQLYNRVRSSVLVIGTYYKCTKCPNWHVLPASGYVITADGVAVTNYHVVHIDIKGEMLVAQTADGLVLPVKEVLAASQADDIAIVQLDLAAVPLGARLVPAPLAPDAPVGEPVAVVSHPDNHFYLMTQGTIARYCLSNEPQSRGATRLQITADFARGSSGAPVCDTRGSVVGMVTSTESVYYSTENNQQKNLQMVFKQCIPAARILALIQPPAHDKATATR